VFNRYCAIKGILFPLFNNIFKGVSANNCR
jgi:hypothetical protein